ncbi:beta-glucosidase family protein [Paenibacillus lutimineralis]|uniref:Glycosyl hydrolase n=1 Tax=Paenibacillus lutimineralis TaxID=2707005 RepID=A0A3S9UV03_9BACL|nr:glycoside hydrolase family 3 C-terminal domain-containing protein [Paenibacillus lutimineralis]AZS14124.1 glycosyl hydrolase [Paenibacillus lutimineralis]
MTTRDIQSIIRQMTLQEKAAMCSGADFWNLKGIERLGIPSIMVTDGPHGLRKQIGAADHLGFNQSVPATCFPSAAGLASSWNRELLERVGTALGEECQAEDVAILLGPGANIKRSPLCGRNFEYFSEDPYLSSEMAASHIQGVQSQGVGTSLKHFAANNQEYRRMSTDVTVDERTLREIYLASFENAVKRSQPWTVMCAYNKVNGEFASENKRLLSDILRDEWNFQGFVVSDWGAVNERVDALQAGLELEMPTSDGGGEAKIIAAVQKGELSEKWLDQAVERLLRIIFKAMDGKKENAVYDKMKHHELAKEAAIESTVLLKNEGQILPLSRASQVAVIGALAQTPRYQGGGSSHIHPTRLDYALEEITHLVGSTNVRYEPGYALEHDEVEEELIRAAQEAAKQSDAAILFIGLPDRCESEGYDREHLRIPYNQIALIEAIAEVQPNVVAVLSNGAPVEMPWLGKVKGLFEGYLGGQASGSAIAALLFGEANPSGKLAETFPLRLEDNPSYLNFPGEGDRVDYREGIFVGYRHYEAKKIQPLFPFGFGLSYTVFTYQDLEIHADDIQDNEELTVTVTVHNAGNRPGQEIVQLYVRDVQSTVLRPEKELKGFQKIFLEPGASRAVTFHLDHRAFSYYNVDINSWHVETGEFEILIGKSSAEIELAQKVMVRSTAALPLRIDRNTLICDLLADPSVGTKARQELDHILLTHPFAKLQEDKEFSGMMEAMINNLPLRALSTFSGGSFTEEMMNEMIARLNRG